MADRGSRHRLLLAFQLASTGLLVAAGVSATPLEGSPVAAVHPPIRPGLSPTVPNASRVGFTVSASPTWVASGGLASFVATWNSSDALCSLAPQWYRWSVPAPSAGLLLESGLGPNETALAYATTLSTATLLVRSAAELSCGGWSETVLQEAESTVTVVPQLAVQEVASSPDPAPPHTPVTLSGLIAGGASPYVVRVVWGDGIRSVVPRSEPGPFTLTHTYAGGAYSPAVVVVDSLGQTASAAAAQDEQVSPGPALGVTPSAWLAEPGVPIRLEGTFANAPAVHAQLLVCGSGPNVTWGAQTSSAVCVPSSAGVQNVTYTALSVVLPHYLVDRFAIPVVARLNVSVAPIGSGEVGAPQLAEIVLSGGVPPIGVRWAGGPTGTVGRSEMARTPWVDAGNASSLVDGVFLVPLANDSPGGDWIHVWASDADGVAAATSLHLPPEAAALGAAVAVHGIPGPDPAICTMLANASGGVGPVAWALLTSSPFSSNVTPAGIVPLGAGAWDWNGTFRVEGSTPLGVEVVDALGVVADANGPCFLGPPLDGRFTVGWHLSPAGAEVAGFLEIVGGRPPFTLSLGAVNQSATLTTEPVDGNYTLLFGGSDSRATEYRLTLVDALGYRLALNATLGGPPPTVPPLGAIAPPTRAGPPVPWYLLWTVPLAVGGAVLFLLARRRRAALPEPFSPPDPVATVRSILAPADGADRLTIEMLAEERGIPLEVVRATIDRLIAGGQIRAEATPEGEEVLAWAALLPS